MEWTKMIKFTILGLPTAKGRPRFAMRGKFAAAYTPAKTREAERDFKLQALKYAPEKPIEGPLSITMNIFKPKPKSYSKKVIHWTSKPDLDNFIKILDCLNGIFWKDDSQIVKIVASKSYDDKARTEMAIEEII